MSHALRYSKSHTHISLNISLLLRDHIIFRHCGNGVASDNPSASTFEGKFVQLEEGKR